MVWHKFDSRELYILETLEICSVDELDLLYKLDVSKKTLAKDIKDLNVKLENCAVIDTRLGELSLFVYNYTRYRKVLNSIKKEELNFNYEKFRHKYIIKSLFEKTNLTLGDLSDNMIVSKSTLSKDINKLNQILETYNLKVEGKPNVGMSIVGDEIDIRYFYLDNCYYEFPKKNKNEMMVNKIVERALSQYLIDEDTIERVVSFIMVSITRSGQGKFIEDLEIRSDVFYKDFIYEIGEIFRKHFKQYLSISLTDNELAFILIPLKGMRTPLILNNISDLDIKKSTEDIINEIFRAIKIQMGLQVDLGNLTKEFSYHVYFSINRIELGYKIDNPLIEEIKSDYRVAYKMAEIASNVIENSINKKVAESEKSFLATYFQIYVVEKLDLANRNGFKIGIFTEGKINDTSLKKKLKAEDLNNDLSIGLLDNTDLDLSGFDLLILNQPIDSEVYQITGDDIFNYQLIKEEIQALKENKNMILSNRFLKSVFLSNLDEDTFFKLQFDSFEENFKYMIDMLKERELIDDDFEARILEKENSKFKIFTERVAFPHISSDALKVALGICENSYPNLIFLVGVPDNLDELLVKLYDEIVTISNDDKLIDKISKIKSYSELMEFFIKETNLFR